MNAITLRSDPRVKVKFAAYPEEIREKMEVLRSLILETAEELDSVTELEETLKWGEPSYLTPKGSTLRIDWKPKNPTVYSLYFKCTSKLVETFRELYADDLQFEKNRAIVIEIHQELNRPILKKCITAALEYHRVKTLPYLGIEQ